MVMEGRELAAPCGLYCGACSIYVARKREDVRTLERIARQMKERVGREVTLEDLACEGCLSEGPIAAYCRDCVLRACAKDRGVTHCSRCPDFPCQPITDFNNDGMPHHSEVLANIRMQREVGVDGWLEEQNKRWRCHACNSPVHWYARKCPKCSEAFPNSF